MANNDVNNIDDIEKVAAEQVKVQPQQPQQPNMQQGYYVNPFFIPTAPNATLSNPTGTSKPVKDKKVGVFIASILTFIGAAVLVAISCLMFIDFIKSAETDAGRVLLFFLYLILGFGLITVIPSLGLNVAAIICSAMAIKSSSKAIKVFAILILILSSILFLVFCAMMILVPYGISG